MKEEGKIATRVLRANMQIALADSKPSSHSLFQPWHKLSLQLYIVSVGEAQKRDHQRLSRFWDLNCRYRAVAVAIIVAT